LQWLARALGRRAGEERRRRCAKQVQSKLTAQASNSEADAYFVKEVEKEIGMSDDKQQREDNNEH
jgi:hypothetical protein